MFPVLCPGNEFFYGTAFPLLFHIHINIDRKFYVIRAVKWIKYMGWRSKVPHPPRPGMKDAARKNTSV